MTVRTPPAAALAAWGADAVFYHLYPLGCLDAPRRNDGHAPPVNRLRALEPWLEHMRALGTTALLLGPVFEAETHGYDVIDHTRVDRRLGSREDLAALVARAHALGLRVVLDGVFHHVGRRFPPFQDVMARGPTSPFADWFHLDFSRPGPEGAPFAYQTWRGHPHLVKLNVGCPAVRAHLLAAVADWQRTFAIDGLRLDAADSLDRGFQRILAAHARTIDPAFWLLGEVIHGDYRRWTGPGSEANLDSVTDYVSYKGLWSSHNDGNYFELAHTWDRQYGPQGIYRRLPLYGFADNHDVMRIASRLHHAAHLYPLHILLFAGPMVPALYYGSEAGIAGVQAPGDDAPLRPALMPPALADAGHPDLMPVIRRLIAVRRALPCLRHGAFDSVTVAARHYAFRRSLPEAAPGTAGRDAVVAVNAAPHPVSLDLRLPDLGGRHLIDRLNPGMAVAVAADGGLSLPLDPAWGRILEAV